MLPPIRLRGAVVSGVGEGAFFVGLEWFRRAVRDVAGFDPYPGTLNVRLVEAVDLDRWRAARDEIARPVTPPGPADCGSRLVLVRLNDASDAAVVIPDVTRYEDDVLEILAADHLRTRLDLRDGDVVSVMIGRASSA